eukprot:SAG22_NODE_995_length_6117_cov_3.445995_2_plen_513_part_00
MKPHINAVCGESPKCHTSFPAAYFSVVSGSGVWLRVNDSIGVTYQINNEVALVVSGAPGLTNREVGLGTCPNVDWLRTGWEAKRACACNDNWAFRIAKPGEATVMLLKAVITAFPCFLLFLCLSLRFHCAHIGPLQSAAGRTGQQLLGGSARARGRSEAALQLSGELGTAPLLAVPRPATTHTAKHEAMPRAVVSIAAAAIAMAAALAPSASAEEGSSGKFLTEGSPWPYPAELSAGSAGALFAGEGFNITVTNPRGAHKHLHSNAARYTDAIRSARGSGCNGSAAGGAQNLTVCTVTVKDTTVPLGPGVDESYSLHISSSAACSMTAPTVWGAFRAMESLRALFGENCTTANIAPLSISDAPRFGFRGLMIDTSRHFMPVPFIQHILDGMEANKLNVLHWHIVDSISFPYVSSLFPGLSGKGAYSPRATYSPVELKGLVEYAMARGVRIMPEYDMPGHGDWEQGEPQIMVMDGPCENTMNPTKPETYTFLAKFVSADISSICACCFLLWWC